MSDGLEDVRDLAAVTEERDRLRASIAEEAEGLLGHSELGQMPATEKIEGHKAYRIARDVIRSLKRGGGE